MGALHLPDKIICEPNALENNSELLSSFGGKALIVTGPHVGHSIMMNRLTKALDKSGIKYEVFDGINGEPTDTMIANGVIAYNTGKCDFCIGFGGGSPLDSAKAIASMISYNGSITDFMGMEIDWNVPPIIAIPTTAGTGSEATRFTIVTDTKKGIKMLLKGNALIPRLAIVDYTLGINAPKTITAATGLDALTHAVEAYISRKASSETDHLAIEAIKRIMKYLPIAYKDGNNEEARCEMAQAALYAGICINNSSVTIVHGMSRPIGALFHVPHGISNAMLLSTCMNDLIDSATVRFAELARIMGIQSDNNQMAAKAFVAELDKICRTCEVPYLRNYDGIDKDTYMANIDKMARDAIESGSPANAPKCYTVSDCKHLYIKAYENQ